MIATRFKYDYTLRDAFRALLSLFKKEKDLDRILSSRFPGATIYSSDSARIGIHHLLKSFDLKPGAKIGIQPYTCSSVFSAIRAAGYAPEFIDINTALVIDVQDLEKKINKIDALIVTHIFGFPADISAIKNIASGIPVIEDCAHAFHSEYDGKHVGTFFDGAVFSLGDGKFPSLGRGGIIILNTKKYNARLKDYQDALQSPGFIKELKNIIHSYASALLHSKVGYSLINKLTSKRFWEKRSKGIYKFPSVELKLFKSVKYMLAHKLNLYENRSRIQNNNGSYLTARLENIVPLIKPGTNFVNYFAFPVMLEERDRVFDTLNDKGIGCGKHFQHAMLWAAEFGYEKGSCPVFEKLVGQILTLPVNYSLNKRVLDKVATGLMQSLHAG